jgi:hypothetical protein
MRRLIVYTIMLCSLSCMAQTRLPPSLEMVRAASTPAPAAGGEDVVTAGLIHKWILAGDMNDSIGTNNGSVVGSGVISATGVAGLPNTAYYFSGTGHIDAGAPLLPTNNFTYTFWANNPNGGVIVALGGGGDDGGNNGSVMFWGYLGSCVTFRRGSNVATYDIQQDLPGYLTGWHFIAVTCDSVDGGKRYYDGALYGSNTNATYITLNPNWHWTMGMATGLTFPGGKIALVRMYNRAITSEEQLTIYNKEKAQ